MIHVGSLEVGGVVISSDDPRRLCMVALSLPSCLSVDGTYSSVALFIAA